MWQQAWIGRGMSSGNGRRAALISTLCALVWGVGLSGPAWAISSESQEEKAANYKKQAQGGLFQKWTFDADAVGTIPGGFVTLSAEDGGSGLWAVVQDATAPTTPNVVSAISECESGPCHRLLLAQGLEYEYPDLSVRFRPVAGAAASGGMVLGAKDARNFYAAVVDVAGRSARVIRIVDGVMTVLGQAEVTLKPIEWHSLRMQRNTIISKDFLEVFVDGVLVLSVEDQALGLGQVGLLAQGKTSLLFDAFHAVPLFSHRPLSPPAPY